MVVIGIPPGASSSGAFVTNMPLAGERFQPPEGVPITPPRVAAAGAPEGVERAPLGGYHRSRRSGMLDPGPHFAVDRRRNDSHREAHGSTGAADR
jgi:hypothetical protein